MMFTKRMQTLAWMGAMLMATAVVACDPENSAEDCDPADAACVCTVGDTDEVCDPEQDDDCACALQQEQEDDPDMGGGDDPDMEDPDMGGEELASYRYVIIEDLTQGARAPYPGVDLDAVTLEKADGAKFYASKVEDFVIEESAENEASNVDAVKGAPDDACTADKTKFVALGGEGNYITVSFTTNDEDVVLEEGDTVTIHEIGKASCPDDNYDDDPYKASISISVMKDDGNFVELGDGDGEASLLLPALP